MLDLKTTPDRLWDWLTDDFNSAAALATPYPGRALAALATRVGLSFPGHRVEKVPRAELLDAIRETVRAQPAERKRVLDEVVAALQVHRAAVSGLHAGAVERWLAVPDEAVGIRRLLAIVAFGAPEVVQIAERWWRASVKNAADDVAADAQADHELSVLTAAMEQAARPLGEAASILQEVFAQVRGLALSLEQEEARRTQLLTKQAADLTKGHDAILRELARLQSWVGEQQRCFGMRSVSSPPRCGRWHHGWTRSKVGCAASRAGSQQWASRSNAGRRSSLTRGCNSERSEGRSATAVSREVSLWRAAPRIAVRLPAKREALG